MGCLTNGTENGIYSSWEQKKHPEQGDIEIQPLAMMGAGALPGTKFINYPTPGKTSPGESQGTNSSFEDGSRNITMDIFIDRNSSSSSNITRNKFLR